MAARTKKIRHDEETRSKIQASQLINRLMKQALSEGDDIMTPNQIKAAEILLRKTLPDLSHETLAADKDSPLVLNVRRGKGS